MNLDKHLIKVPIVTNIRLNQGGDRIKVYELALSDRTGRQPLYVPWQNHGSLETSASLNAAFKPKHSSVLNVPVSTLDSFVRETGISAVGSLKIDVESTEHLVLAGGGSTIQKDRPLIVLEVLHLADHKWLNRFCREQNYRVFTLHPEAVKARNHVAFEGTAWNQCFCPEERIERLQESADTIGLKFGA